eukprot:snap_masked-scaffold_37-processed-gene-1.17-mRNA-1 protein AED:1.00 eAED:1.00 QI:0/0/0/0/1/1/2/0/91
MLDNNFTKNMSIYISTEPKRPKWYFDVFEEFFEEVFYSDNIFFKPIMEKIQYYTKSKQELSYDIFGIIEQLICVNAKYFQEDRKNMKKIID